MSFKKILLWSLLSTLTLRLSGQEQSYAKEIINHLCSKELQGRGYAFGADRKAAAYIAGELKKFGIHPLKKGYCQEFSIPVNTLPKARAVQIDNRKLQAGEDYLIAANSCSVKGKFPIVILDAKIINDRNRLSQFVKQDFSKKALWVDTSGVLIENFERMYQLWVNQNILQAELLLIPVSTPLMYVPSQNQVPFCTLYLKRGMLQPERDRNITVNIEAHFQNNYRTNNVFGILPGKSDSCIFLCAHYDHIGLMGEHTYFPGANDNASGVAMVLDLARRYARQTKPKYTMVFAFFSGEELGLLGSRYYTEHPILPLSQIKFLINLDMVGSGKKGITVVNGTVFKREFNLLRNINEEKQYLPEVKERGAAANSDHYFFYEKGVKSFFFYTRGDYKEYHNIFDSSANLPLAEFADLEKLIKEWIEKI